MILLAIDGKTSVSMYTEGKNGLFVAKKGNSSMLIESPIEKAVNEAVKKMLR